MNPIPSLRAELLRRAQAGDSGPDRRAAGVGGESRARGRPRSRSRSQAGRRRPIRNPPIAAPATIKERKIARIDSYIDRDARLDGSGDFGDIRPYCPWSFSFQYFSERGLTKSTIRDRPTVLRGPLR